MFREKLEYIGEVFETLVYGIQDRKIIVSNVLLNKDDIIKVLFGITRATYDKYLKQCMDSNSDINSVMSQITRTINRVSFDAKTLEDYNLGNLEVDESVLLSAIKQTLISYKNDLGYNEINLKRINEFDKIVDLYKYIFSNAYDDNEKMLIVDPDINDFIKVLALKLANWVKDNEIIKIAGKIKTSNKFIAFNIKYKFEKDQTYTFNIYIYTGICLTKDLEYESRCENKIINLADNSLSLICVLNPYYNWIRSEGYIQYNKYVTFIKEKDLSLNKIKDYIIVNGIKNLQFLNQLCQSIINKIENYNDIILKQYIYNSSNIFLEKPVDKSISRVEYGLIDKAIQENKGSKDKVRILLIGEYSIESIIKYTDKCNNIFVFSDSKDYVDITYKKWSTNYSVNYPNVNLNLSVFYLGIADSVVAQKRQYFDLIIIGKGYGSFLSNLNKYFLYINYMLKDEGLVLLSFYNSSFNLDAIPLENLHKNLLFVHKEGMATYKLNNQNLNFSISLNDYNENYIEQTLKRFFIVEKKISFPMLAFTNISSGGITDDLKIEIEEAYILSDKNNKDYNGYFLTFLAKKECKENRTGPMMVVDNVNYISHHAMLNKTVQKNYITTYANVGNITEKNILKVLFLKSEKEPNENAILITFYGKFLPKGLPAHFANNSYKFLTIREMNKLGIEIGNISPFSFSNVGINHRFYDKKLDYYDKRTRTAKNKMIVYFGSNNCYKTYYMDVCDLVTLLRKNQFKSVEV